MDELRMVRREDQSLIVATETGDEYRLIVDSEVLAELRHLARQLTGGARVNPREIQSLVRAGKTRDEIMQLTGADEHDIERYEEPVLAERRFILSSAQRVPVRTVPAAQADEQFGTVIAERLIGLSAEHSNWSAWRDAEAGWMISLDFEVREVRHRAVWSFEHRKGALAPLTPDAVTLSKQGDLGESLVPKLRAVEPADTADRFDSGVFEPEQLLSAEVTEDTMQRDDRDDHTAPPAATNETALRNRHPSTGSIPMPTPEDEFARRREIEQRAINTPEPEQPDLGETADLLDALRRRRDAHEDSEQADNDQPATSPQPVPLRGEDRRRPQAEPSKPAPQSAPRAAEPSKRGKGRTAIPSWDDILFGTRGDEDPS